MLNKIFENNFPLLTKYFNTLFEVGKEFPQSIVLEGSDIWGQYFFTLELARILNCRKDGAPDCNCVSCNWIRENRHPSVTTISQIDFKPESDESKTVISVKQIEALSKSLAQASEFHRIYVFLNAKKGESEKYVKNQFEKYNGLDFSAPSDSWVPDFLNRKSFANDILNKLLKSIEEPPYKTSFIFLTKNREDLLQTVVSRSFVFKLPAGKFEFETENISEYFKNYPNLTLKDGLTIAKDLEDYAKTNDFQPIEILNSVEQFLGNLRKNNIENEKIRNDILTVQQAKRHIKALIKPQYVFENMMIQICA